jgi:tetraacyldisaccharide 4'-kinase
MPVISVGNLSAGGTGKTPHIEYLIRLLKTDFKIATLSRGYGRKSKGFLESSKLSAAMEIGDEPMQFIQKYDRIIVAVDEKRTRGIGLLVQKHPGLQVILLDDAFQHRYVKPGLSILLTDYHRLYYNDYMLPSGTLREFKSGARRANIIIVTKTPKIFSPITRRRILEDLKVSANQHVFFSYIKYDSLFPMFSSENCILPSKITSILLFTGIANDYPLIEHLERMCSDLIVEKFPDHHPYSEKDLEKIIGKFKDLPTQKKILVTTEKDIMRLKNKKFTNYLENLPLFCIPMEIDFHGTDKVIFDEEILRYVKENSRDH